MLAKDKKPLSPAMERERAGEGLGSRPWGPQQGHHHIIMTMTMTMTMTVTSIMTYCCCYYFLFFQHLQQASI